MLSHLEARLQPGNVLLSGDGMSLVEFRLELGLPIWRYEGHGHVVESRVLMPHSQNTVFLTYRLVEGSHLTIELRPFLHVRHYESSLHTALSGPYSIHAVDQRVEIDPGDDLPHLRLRMYGNQSMLTLNGSRGAHGYREERSRGYAHEGSLWTPGFFHADLGPDPSKMEATLVASTEPWDTVEALTPDAALQTETNRRLQLLEQAPARMRSGIRAELVLAADQFLVTPAERPEGGRAWHRGANRHRGLSLVHRLGSRHDDQPRRAHADHRPRARRVSHPANVCQLRARRAHPQHVSRR
jgi:hypothetical protein